MKATMIRKAYDITDLEDSILKLTDTLDDIEIEKTVVLEKDEFEKIIYDLLSDCDVIKNNLDKMWYDSKKQVWHCLRLRCNEMNFDLIVESEGYNYPRYTSIIKRNK